MKQPNLANKQVDPTEYEVNCTVTVISNQIIDNVPVKALASWLNSLPEDARVKYQGISSGKVYLEASWKETRNG